MAVFDDHVRTTTAWIFRVSCRSNTAVATIRMYLCAANATNRHQINVNFLNGRVITLPMDTHSAVFSFSASEIGAVNVSGIVGFDFCWMSIASVGLAFLRIAKRIGQ